MKKSKINSPYKGKNHCSIRVIVASSKKLFNHLQVFRYKSTSGRAPCYFQHRIHIQRDQRKSSRAFELSKTLGNRYQCTSRFKGSIPVAYPNSFLFWGFQLPIVGSCFDKQFHINIVICKRRKRGEVPTERVEARFEYYDIGVAGPCMNSVFVSYFEMIMFI